MSGRRVPDEWKDHYRDGRVVRMAFDFAGEVTYHLFIALPSERVPDGILNLHRYAYGAIYLHTSELFDDTVELYRVFLN